MRMDTFSGFVGFTVMDLATSTKVENVMWVDDTALEYAVLRYPTAIVDGEFAVDIHKVTSVRADYVNKIIEVNAVAHFPLGQPPAKQPKACHECCQPETCKRIDICVRYRCRFGEDDKP